MAFPDICAFYDDLYGTAGIDLQGLTLLQCSGATGMVFSGNPSYTATDFAAMYPKFLGTPSSFTSVTVASGSVTVTGFIGATADLIGQLVSSRAFPNGTIVSAVSSDGTVVTMSNPATLSVTGLSVYTSPPAPLAVINTYIMLAAASIMQARYQDSWTVAMAYFIAHYLTLYLQTESVGPGATAAQIASSGLYQGILVHQSAGDVSATTQTLSRMEDWGAWQLTQYGVLLITLAQSIAAGPVWVP